MEETPSTSAIQETLASLHRASHDPGKRSAAAARKSLGLNGKPVDDQTLGEVLGLSAEVLGAQPATRATLGLAVRTQGERSFKFLFRRKNPLGRRFEAARFIADYLARGKNDRWLPIADTGTARQKMQRAFAAEFLCQSTH